MFVDFWGAAIMQAGRNCLQPQDLGVILSYQYQSQCAHCIYHCGSAWRDWMTLDALNEVLMMACSCWDQPFQVHLSGGEPFLNFDLLLQAVEAAVRLQLPVYVETNAGWCRDDFETRRRFEILRRAGLGAVLISVSPFHAAHIPLARTLRGIRLAQNVFSTQRVMVYQAQWLPMIARYGVDEPVALACYQQDEIDLWHGFGVQGGGRAGYRLAHLTGLNPAESFRGQRCKQELLFAAHSHVDLYGNFIPAFCGGISLAKWQTLPQLLADFRQQVFPPLIKTLIEAGAYGLYRLAKETHAYQALATGYADKCHLCVDVRKHLVACGDYEVLQPAAFYAGLD